jgi:predicted dehydrogenase
VKPFPSGQTLRVAIVGCGQIADAHLQELRKIEKATIVATCDSHHDLAMQAAMRFGVPNYYEDLKTMLAQERPDIVHIATPAHTHAQLAQEIMQAGAHVYVEKPLALNECQAREVLDAAASLRRCVCVGHDQLFDPAWLDLRHCIERGDIGEVRHVESVLGYPISGPFGRAVGGDANHWVRRLPGGLFQNTISHPLYRITEFLADERPDVVARWWAKPGVEFPTEMFVHLRGQNVTGTLTFSTSISPQRVTRVHGSNGALEVDLDAQTVMRIAPTKLPGAFGKLDVPWRRQREATRALRRNVWRFMRSDIHYFAGMRNLIEHFHHAVRNPQEKWPIAADEMLRVTRIMDLIFADCREADNGLRGMAARSDCTVSLVETSTAAVLGEL